MPTSGARDNCCCLSLPPVDHARITLPYLVHAVSFAQDAPILRILEADSNQACVCCPEHLAVTAASGLVCSQGVRTAMSGAWLQCPFLPTSEMTGANVEPVHRPLLVWATPPSGFWDDCCGFSWVPIVMQESLCCAYPPPLPLAHTRGTQSPVGYTRSPQCPIAWASGFLTSVASARGALLSDIPGICRERDS